MFDLEILIFEFLAINGFATSAIPGCKVTSLNHKTLDYPMETRSWIFA
jgi:hypothetical protein